MKTETLEYALHAWKGWQASLKQVRRRLGYDPKAPYEGRQSWWESCDPESLRDACRQVLAELALPMSFARYWIACFLSDYTNGNEVDPERIRIPIHWLNKLKLPRDAVPTGSFRFEVHFDRFYQNDSPTLKPLEADEVRVYPPPCVAVTVPKWMAVPSLELHVELLPQSQWPEKWEDKSRLPILIDPPPNANPRVSIGFSSKGDARPLDQWQAFATIEVVPWAISEETIQWAHEQLYAIRRWLEVQGAHPMSKLLRQEAGRQSAGRRTPPAEWQSWLAEYLSGAIAYLQLVQRVWSAFTEGKIPKSPASQPKSAKYAADWVRRQLKRMEHSPPRLPRNWWRPSL